MTTDYIEEDFKFWVPAQALSKSRSSKEDKSGKRWIQGVASTDDKDLQGEVVVQKGIDFSYFLKHGYFNSDHKKGVEFKVGHPTNARITKAGLWVKGYLYPKGVKPEADKLWNHMEAVDKTGDRTVGFSIEGKIQRKSGNRITKCWVQDIAITPCPVNTKSWLEMVKSLSQDVEPKELTKSMTFEEVSSYVMERAKLDVEGARVVANVIFKSLQGANK